MLADLWGLIQNSTHGRRNQGEGTTMARSNRHTSNRSLPDGLVTSLFATLNLRETDYAADEFFRAHACAHGLWSLLSGEEFQMILRTIVIA